MQKRSYSIHSSSHVYGSFIYQNRFLQFGVILSLHTKSPPGYPWSPIWRTTVTKSDCDTIYERDRDTSYISTFE
jgi:hypothetical protein